MEERGEENTHITWSILWRDELSGYCRFSVLLIDTEELVDLLPDPAPPTGAQRKEQRVMGGTESKGEGEERF